MEVAGLADCTVVTLVPEAGDEVQTLKAGIMEIADIFVVNKADREAAETLYRHLRSLMHERATDGHEIPVLKTVATTSDGVPAMAEAIEKELISKSPTSEKRLQLLTEKTWQLIQSRKMRRYSRISLKQELESELKKDTKFNLYRFIQKYND